MKRLAGALLISLVGIALSWYFLRPREWGHDAVTTRQAIARVMNVRNDVSRQTEGRLLWSPIRAGDQIFVGDKIKTAGLSTTVVEIDESKSKLEIEENSIVVMARGEKKLALNMLEGRVFVKQDGSAASNIDFVSGGKKIDFSGNTAITVAQDGSSQVESFSGGQNIFSELLPAYSESVFSLRTELELQWKASAQEGVVEVSTGESPLLLKPVAGVSAPFATGKLAVPMKPGTNFWQLTLRVKEQSLKSPLMKLNLVRPQAPTPLYPAESEAVRITDRPFDFKWMKGNAGDSVRLEVARDEAFKTMVLTTDVKDQTFFAPAQPLGPGNYFWRVKSSLPNSEWLESSSVPFAIHQGSTQVSPTPVSPQDHAILYLDPTTGRKLRFEWRKLETAASYETRVQGVNFDKTVASNEPFAEVSLSRPGKYTWEVFAIDGSGKRSVLPTVRDFEVRPTGTISWAMDERKFFYIKGLPIVVLKWQKNFTGTSVLSIAPTADMAQAETFRVRESDFPYRALRDGVYFAQVKALGEDEEVKAESSVLDFQVQEAPLPPAPLLKGAPTKLVANSQGNLRADVANMKPSWLAVAQLKDKAGKVLDERRFSETTLQFGGLLPGSYLFVVKFTDEFKRLSDESTFQVEVPATSKMPAPRIKEIKVR
jgi:preprotein translocase subunit YajC